MKSILAGVGVFVLLFVGIVARMGGFRERAVGASFLALVAVISAVAAIASAALVYRLAW